MFVVVEEFVIILEHSFLSGGEDLDAAEGCEFVCGVVLAQSFC